MCKPLTQQLTRVSDLVLLLSPTKTPTLTLITCYPFRYVGPAPKRFVFQADRVKPAKTKRATSRKTRMAKNRRR
jgi:sortase (surface protein transpeptidase)